MTSTVRLSACERVVVALSTGHQRRTIEQAAKLAQLTRSELLAIFVEDVDLFNLAAMPFSVQITSSGERQPLEVQEIENHLKAIIEATRDEIAKIATAIDVPWRLEVVRDAPEEALRRVAGEKDIVVQPDRDAAHTGLIEVQEEGFGSLVLADQEIHRHDPIAVVAAPGERGEELVRQAAEIAKTQDRSLFVLCLSCSDQGIEHYREIARAEMGDKGQIEYRAIRRFDLAEIATEIHRLKASLVLTTPIPELGLTSRSANRLANLLGLPLLLLR